MVPVDVGVQAVQPHAHYRARDIRGEATLPDGTSSRLIHIKDWDFRWQHVYRFATPFCLPKGHDAVDAIHATTTPPTNPRNPEQPAEARAMGTALVGRDGRSLDPGADA